MPRAKCRAGTGKGGLMSKLMSIEELQQLKAQLDKHLREDYREKGL